MKLEEFKNKRILIVGRGLEGEAALKYLKKHLPNSVIDIVDQKDGEEYLDKQKDYDLAIKSPGVSPSKLTIPYTTSTNIFLSNAKGKIVGITGTKGKSTTTTLIYEMLKAEGLDVYIGGNIGKPALEFLDKLKSDSWTVLEMSSYQLADAKKSPHIVVFLMTSEEHLDFHKTVENYIDAKRNILRFQTPSDFAVINRDYPATNESDVETLGKVFYISREREFDNGSFVRENAVWIVKEGKEEKIIDTSQIKLLGKHNLENVCASVMAAKLAGVSKANMVKVLSSFAGLEHRLEYAGEVGGVLFYNDSLATIPQAAIEALEALPDAETLIAGGYDRGLDYSPLAQYLQNGQVKTLILLPPTGKRIWDEICKITSEGSRPEKFDVTTMEQAVRIAAAETTPGKIALLSPASASFGIFKDYKDRGNQFKEQVRKHGVQQLD